MESPTRICETETRLQLRNNACAETVLTCPAFLVWPSARLHNLLSVCTRCGRLASQSISCSLEVRDPEAVEYSNRLWE